MNHVVYATLGFITTGEDRHVTRENHSPKIYTVSELTREIQTLLEDHFDFVWLEGEISNFSAPVSGHYYMVLKDDAAQIRAVMFRNKSRYLRYMPENGMKVLAQGRAGIYAPRGDCQIILDYLEPMGVGALALAFEQLKKKLAAQGIFDEDIKRPLPYLPQSVAVITSPTGAAIRDFLKVITRRFANIEITVVPVRVQGDEAASDMVKALELVNDKLKVDVIILTRGGGSLEDLWAFNEEILALAIRKSRIPVVSAVGHEIDLTISDLAADFRAPTPSAAAELLVMEKESLLDRLSEIKDRLLASTRLVIKQEARELARLQKGLKDPRRRLADLWMRVDEIHSRIIRAVNFVIKDGRTRLKAETRAMLRYSPANIIASMRQRLDFQTGYLDRAINGFLNDKQAAVSVLQKRIMDLSPLSILSRGYSITLKLPEKIVLKSSTKVDKGDHVQVLLAEGGLKCVVENREPNRVK